MTLSTLLSNLPSLYQVEFTHPWILYCIPGVVLFLIVLMVISTVDTKGLTADDKKTLRRRMRRWRISIFISRFLIFSLLILALSGPYTEQRREVDGNVQLTILMDNSTSMELYDSSQYQVLIDELKTLVPTRVYTIASDEESTIGDGILAQLEPDNQYLIITDGRVTSGTSLADVSVFASNINSTISSLTLFPDKEDVGVEVFGPSKTIESVENTFKIRVNTANLNRYRIQVTLDGSTILDTTSSEESHTITQKIGPGHHTMIATVQPIEGVDYFPQNNVFYKTIKVVEKPSILIVHKEQFEDFKIYDELYDTTYASSLPNDISKYTAIILKDLPADAIPAQQLIEYTTDGNGLLVFGGDNSFDYGDYEDSLFEKILPVEIGSGEEETGEGINVVIVMDISYSGRKFKGSGKGSTDQENFQKSLAISLLQGLGNETKAGAVAFRDKSFLVSRMRTVESGQGDLIDKLARLEFASSAIEGGTNIFAGLAAAHQIVDKYQGSKNIILISDGKDYPRTKDRDNSIMNLVKKLSQQEYRFYTVSPAPEADTAWLKKIANEGKGFFFEPTSKQKLRILFAPPENLPPSGLAMLVTLNEDHFITRRLNIEAALGSFNEVRPKPRAQQLIALETGHPTLTIWRYGLGRVGAFTSHARTGGLGQVLDEQNSKLVSRMVNWAVGDPERNKDYVVTIFDGKRDDPMNVVVRSNKVPEAEGFEFIRTGEDQYAARIDSSAIGSFEVLNTPYAVNYHKEYAQVGVNVDFEQHIIQAGGRLFHPEETNEIYEFVKNRSKRIRIEKINIQWPLLVLAMGIFFLEIVLRRIIQTML